MSAPEERSLEEWDAALRGEEAGMVPLCLQMPHIPEARLAALLICAENEASPPPILHYEIGSAYAERQAGNHETNMEKAVASLTRAWDGVRSDPQAPPDAVFEIGTEYAIALGSDPSSGEDALAASLTVLDALLEVAEGNPEDEVMTLNNKGTLLVQHGKYEEAGEAYAAALEKVDPNSSPESWGWITNAQAEAFLELWLRGDDDSLFDPALDGFQSALDVLDEINAPAEVAQVKFNIGRALSSKLERLNTSTPTSTPISTTVGHSTDGTAGTAHSDDTHADDTHTAELLERALAALDHAIRIRSRDDIADDPQPAIDLAAKLRS